MEWLLVGQRKNGHVGNRCCWRQLVLLVLSVAASGVVYADKAVFRVENGTIIVSSPFDLEMGSTEYAKIAGKVLTRMVLGLDKVLCFTGKIGDIGIEIAYAAPRYAKSKGTYSIACRGAVIASFVQSPIFSEEQAKKKAK